MTIRKVYNSYSERRNNAMTRLELLMVLYALKGYLEKGMYEEAEDLIDKIIEEAKKA